MAHQAYVAHSQQQNRGTLPPGHTLVVNKYTVQVERYLSQGGFAHVYVVRTSEPVNNTTQHVLKRIAVADAAMLANVKKEVDIMRILRGHPNIVNFIDASWNALPNGTYEVLILMELCSGGGIIDMMNRRLRERLTEVEILQIFVDVCEAVAAMHNLKPPLLHRDLKVENILQSTATRYKLCDFGSSTPVAHRPPSSAQEIRALEAELNRHTTLQYRAPEMVDVYLRRPVDEKSDVWALGVLLYKLCYYTTPFEEHGPLAILNVQYRIPPYPVYSAQMNSLIASMLRELGAQRPSVFEILNIVHRMRGSKSAYQYNIPMQLSLRPTQTPSSRQGLDDIITFRTSPAPNANPNAAMQARQTVLDAIAPMRRGRPIAQSIPTSTSPPKQEKDVDARKFDEKWRAIKAKASEGVEDVWGVGAGKTKGEAGFGDSFDGFGDSSTDPKLEMTARAPAPSPSSATSKPVSTAKLEVKDAFDGLGISRSREASPTLGEVRDRKSKAGASGSTKPPRLSAVSLTPVPTPLAAPLSPHIPASRTGLATYRSPTSLTAEDRFPSLDELDRGWRSPPTSLIPPAHAPSQPELSNQFALALQQNAKAPQSSVAHSHNELRPSEPKLYDVPLKGEARSQQVTGTAKRGEKVEGPAEFSSGAPSRAPNVLDRAEKHLMPIGSSPTKYRPSRPALARKHRSSVSMKYTEPRSPSQDWLTGNDSGVLTSPVEASASPVRKRSSPGVPAPVVGSGDRALNNDTVQTIGDSQKHDIEPAQDGIYSFKRQDDFPKPRMSRIRQSADSTSHRQDSSSDDAEGPEDVNDRIVAHDIRRKRAKSRQSSVHDLVDLYGGSGHHSAERDGARPPSPGIGRKGRRTSEILVDISLPSSAQTHSNLLSPATIVPESRAELASRRSGSASQAEHVSPLTRPPNTHDSDSRPESRTSPMDRKEKARPKSMFMFPQPKPLDSEPRVASPGGARRRHSPRRGSISDMVDLYENMGGGRSKDPPAIGNKPAGLRLNKTPSPSTSRFPPVSPTGRSFPASTSVTETTQVQPKPRRSPTTDSYNDPISSTLPTTENNRNKFGSRVPRRRSVSPAKPTPAPVKLTPVSVTSPPKPVKPPSLSIATPVNNVASLTPRQRTPGAETPISPSPERPYQGVGKLIDQWQKKSEAADAARQRGTKPAGRPLGPRAVGRAR